MRKKTGCLSCRSRKENKNIDREYLAKLCDARDTLCEFCEADECEKCIVAHLIDDAYNELGDEEAGDD